MSVLLYSDWDASKLTKPEGQVGHCGCPWQGSWAPHTVTIATEIFPGTFYWKEKEIAGSWNPCISVQLKDVVLLCKLAGVTAKLLVWEFGNLALFLNISLWAIPWTWAKSGSVTLAGCHLLPRPLKEWQKNEGGSKWPRQMITLLRKNIPGAGFWFSLFEKS